MIIQTKIFWPFVSSFSHKHINELIMFLVSFWFFTVNRCKAPCPHSKKVLGSTPGTLCVELVSPPWVCVGFLQKQTCLRQLETLNGWWPVQALLEMYHWIQGTTGKIMDIDGALACLSTAGFDLEGKAPEGKNTKHRSAVTFHRQGQKFLSAPFTHTDWGHFRWISSLNPSDCELEVAFPIPPFLCIFFTFLFSTCIITLASSPGCTVIQNSCILLLLAPPTPHPLLSSVFHRFCLDRAGDSDPLWGILGNKSHSCLHVEAHGKVLAHFFTQTNISAKWRKVGQKKSSKEVQPQSACL